MKKLLLITLLCAMSFQSKAQAEEIQQLMLNIEKLMQFRKILQNMYDAFKLLSNGYNAVKDISEGNFNLHKTFLDGLAEVSPAVKKYKRIADIIDYQLRVVNDSKKVLQQFQADKQFSADELNYLTAVYDNLIRQTLKHVEELLLVVTAGKLRMNDEERLQAIDRIFVSVESQYGFVREFSNSTKLLSILRKSEQQQIERMRVLHQQ
jgi:DNA repair ATPase RecN